MEAEGSSPVGEVKRDASGVKTRNQAWQRVWQEIEHLVPSEVRR